MLKSYRLKAILALTFLLVIQVFITSTNTEAQSVGQEMGKEASSLLGTPYHFGGTSPASGFDSSGLIYYLHKQQGLDIPRTVSGQASEGTFIAKDQLQPGDTVFFKNSKGNAVISAIYVGNNEVITSIPSLNGVSKASLATKAAIEQYLGAKRYFTLTENSNSEAKIVNTVNFRSAPSTSSSILGVLQRGTIVNVVEEISKYWLKVEINNHVGYISASSNFVELVNPSDREGSDPVKAPAPTPAPSPTPTPTPTPPSEEALGDKIIETGEKYFGTPYRFGARSGSGYFDCSLFTQTVFAENGIRIPRSSRQQAQLGTFVKWGEWEKGDLLFFWTRATGEGVVGHVAIYAGDGKMLHTWGSPGVSYSSVDYYSWKRTYMGAKRIIE